MYFSILDSLLHDGLGPFASYFGFGTFFCVAYGQIRCRNYPAVCRFFISTTGGASNTISWHWRENSVEATPI